MTATPRLRDAKALQGDDRTRTGAVGESCDCREIPVGGLLALVDADDFDRLTGRAWSLHRSDTKIYARAKVSGRQVFMHRLILGLWSGDSRVVDHINGDSLDNRRTNLRVVTAAGNAQNQGSRGGSSRYRGVSWDRSRGKWMARAMLDGRGVTIGRFDSEDEAGAAAAAWRARNMPHSIEGMAA